MHILRGGEGGVIKRAREIEKEQKKEQNIWIENYQNRDSDKKYKQT